MKKSLDCTIMRGGTSKAVFLRGEDLPGDKNTKRDIILQIFGSPDKRQIDGLGGADPLTSKLAVINKPTDELSSKADLIYSFGQVEINVSRSIGIVFAVILHLRLDFMQCRKNL